MRTLILGLALALGAPTQVSADSPKQALASEAPSFLIKTLDGKTLTNSSFKGQVVVLNFWAGWCPPCLMELPAFGSFADEHPEVAVIGVAVDTSSDEVRSIQARTNANFTMALGTNEIVSTFGVRGLPTTVIIGKDGHVAQKVTGMTSEAELLRMTSAL